MLKRSLLSIAVGIGITCLPVIVVAAFGLPLRNRWDGLLTGIAILNYWPSWVLRPPLTRIDCPSADSIADKLSCMWISAVISTLTYALLFFVFSFWFARRRRPRVR